tara:strand:+ start:747 stop:1016 length:270 start_codon:yes stop_codon:yes gene_type:complete
MGAEQSEERLVQEIISLLVDKQEDIHISSTITDHTAVFDIRVADSDVGKVLGRKGAHADALRTIFGAIYGKTGKKLHLQIVDPRKGRDR